MLDFPDDGQIRFRKIRDAGSVLNATFEIIKRNAREMVVSYLAIVAPVAVASSIASLLWVSRMGAAFSDPEVLASDPLAVFGSAYVFSLVFSLFTFAVAQAAASGYVRLYRQGQAGHITAGALWDETRGLVLPILGLTLVAGLAAMLSAVVNIIPCLGSLVWIALIVWAWPVVSVALVSRVVESDTISQAWTRARTLVKGSWGFAFGSLFLAWVVAGLLAVAVGLVGALVGGVAGIGFGITPDLSEGISIWMTLVQAVSSVLTMAFYLLPFVAAFFVHGRLAEELDGTTLHDDLDVLSEAGFDLPAPPSGPGTSTPPSLDAPTDGPHGAPDADDDRLPRPDDGGFRGGGFGA